MYSVHTKHSPPRDMMAHVMPLLASFHLHCILEGRRHGVQPTKAHLVSRWESAFALTELSEDYRRCRIRIRLGEVPVRLDRAESG